MLKLGAAALGGYVLGRLKKGKAAVGFAMWAAGVKADPKQMLRQGLINFASSAEGQQLLSQLRGPLLEAGKKAAGATIEGQVAALTSALQKRTSALTEGSQQDDGDEPEQAEDREPTSRRRKGKRKGRAARAEEDAAEDRPDDEDESDTTESEPEEDEAPAEDEDETPAEDEDETPAEDEDDDGAWDDEDEDVDEDDEAGLESEDFAVSDFFSACLASCLSAPSEADLSISRLRLAVP
jgi:hypothetical protein